MKQEIREKHLKNKNSIAKKDVLEKSSLIQQELFSLPEFQKAKTIAFYASTGKEVRTIEMIQKSIEMKKQVLLPFISKKKEIGFSEISSLSGTENGKYGILEPKNKNPFPIQKIGLLVVPGIAFDEQGNRLGRGKGYYDKLLSKLDSKTCVVGLCFEQNIEEKLPTEPHDKKVNIVVTEKRILAD